MHPPTSTPEMLFAGLRERDRASARSAGSTAALAI
jgi:hypothetical protein